MGIQEAVAGQADLADQVRRACASRPTVARWAPELAAAATKHADAWHGLAPVELALDLSGLMSRETGGENILGDGGHGRGLMQIDDRSHAEWLAAHADGMDPASNVDQGAEIYVSGLVVIANHEAAAGRARSQEELRRFAMAAYNVGLRNKHGTAVLDQLDAGRDPDEHTTPGPTKRGDYGADVWRRREAFAAALGQPGVCG